MVVDLSRDAEGKKEAGGTHFSKGISSRDLARRFAALLFQKRLECEGLHRRDEQDCGRVGGERTFESFTIPKWPPEVRVEKMVANDAGTIDKAIL